VVRTPCPEEALLNLLLEPLLELLLVQLLHVELLDRLPVLVHGLVEAVRDHSQGEVHREEGADDDEEVEIQGSRPVGVPILHHVHDIHPALAGGIRVRGAGEGGQGRPPG
jgi:hypothetical protein